MQAASFPPFLPFPSSHVTIPILIPVFELYRVYYSHTRGIPVGIMGSGNSLSRCRLFFSTPNHTMRLAYKCSAPLQGRGENPGYAYHLYEA